MLVSFFNLWFCDLPGCKLEYGTEMLPLAAVHVAKNQKRSLLRHRSHLLMI